MTKKELNKALEWVTNNCCDALFLNDSAGDELEAEYWKGVYDALRNTLIRFGLPYPAGMVDDEEGEEDETYS